MLFPPGATSQSVQVQLVDDTGLALTGKVAADFPTVQYQKSGANAAVTITLSDLAALTTAYSSGGVKEIGGGWYRMDLPDAALSTAARVVITGDTTGKHLLAPSIDVKGDWLLASSYAAPPSAASIAQAVLTDTTDLTTAGSIGKLIHDNLDAPVSLVKAQTDKLLFDGSSFVKSDPQTAVSVSGTVSADVVAWGGITVFGTIAPDALFTTYGTAQAGAASSITLANTGSPIDDTYDGQLIRIYSGTGQGQTRIIRAYNGASKVATVDAWKTAPDATSMYLVIASDLAYLDAAVSGRMPSGDVTIGGYAAGQDPATLVLDTAASGHDTAGTIGAEINAAGNAGDPWTTSLPGSYGAGSAGYIVGHNLDGQVSLRLLTSAYTTPPTTGAIAAAVMSDVTDTVGQDIAAMKTVSDHLGTTLQLDGAGPNYQFTTGALANAPGGGGSGDLMPGGSGNLTSQAGMAANQIKLPTGFAFSSTGGWKVRLTGQISSAGPVQELVVTAYDDATGITVLDRAWDQAPVLGQPFACVFGDDAALDVTLGVNMTRLLGRTPYLASLAGLSIVIVSPVGRRNMTISRSGAYKAMHNDPLDFVKPPGAEWPADLSLYDDFTLTLTKSDDNANPVPVGASNPLVISGDLLVATGPGQAVRFEMGNAASAQLAIGSGTRGYDIRITCTRSGDTIVLLEGQCTVTQ